MKIDILCRSLGKQCGIAEYALALAERLKARPISCATQAMNPIVMIEYEPALYHSINDLLCEAFHLRPALVLVDILRELPPDMVSRLSEQGVLAAVKTASPHTDLLLPLIDYPQITVDSHQPEGLKLGSFGFAVPNKRYGLLIKLSTRLGIPLLILSSQATVSPSIGRLSRSYLRSLRKSAPANVEIDSRFLTNEEIIKRLRSCSHLVCAMKDLGLSSGSLRLMSQAERPIISLPCQGAKEVGAHIVHSLDDLSLETLQQSLPLPLVGFKDGLPRYQLLLKSLLRESQMLEQFRMEMLHVYSTN